jgi:hypothetical protein
MKFKLLVVMTDDDKSGQVVETARANGATGCTVITNARGEGLKPAKTFMGLTVAGQRDVILLMVEEHLSRHILEEIGAVCRFDVDPGTGVAFQIDIEDAIGLRVQIETIGQEIGGEEL